MSTPPFGSPFNRRGFLATAAGAAAAGSLGPIVPLLRAEPGKIAETDAFWYRLAPSGPYIDSQRGRWAFAFGDGKVFLSDDVGKTWAHSAAFPEAENITFSIILKNGDVLFATRERLFLGVDGLKSIQPVPVKDRHGRDYLPHTPQNPDLPGWYFHSLDGVHAWDVDGREMLVWGNYCNVEGGAVPVNIYYSTDGGRTVKIAYSFGRNASFQEKGTAPANFLGDPENPVVCRHVHSVTYHPAERAFYACTGDLDRTQGHECHWLRGTYDAAADSWDWKILVSVNSNSRFKSGGISFVDGLLYWAADANGAKAADGSYDRGIFRCAPADLPDVSKHTQLFNAPFEMANLIIENGVIVAGHCAPASALKTGLAYSADLGKTWKEYDLAEFGPRSPLRFDHTNDDGWFRFDLRKGWITRGEVLFLKPKPQA